MQMIYQKSIQIIEIILLQCSNILRKRAPFACGKTSPCHNSLVPIGDKPIRLLKLNPFKNSEDTLKNIYVFGWRGLKWFRWHGMLRRWKRWNTKTWTSSLVYALNRKTSAFWWPIVRKEVLRSVTIEWFTFTFPNIKNSITFNLYCMTFSR